MRAFTFSRLGRTFLGLALLAALSLLAAGVGNSQSVLSQSAYMDPDGQVEMTVVLVASQTEIDGYASVQNTDYADGQQGTEVCYDPDEYGYDGFPCGIDYVTAEADLYDNGNYAGGSGYAQDYYEAEASTSSGVTLGHTYDLYGWAGACYNQDPDWDAGDDGYDGNCDYEGLGLLLLEVQAGAPSISSITVNSGALGTNGSTVVTGQNLIDDFGVSNTQISGGVQTSIEPSETQTQATVDFTIPQSATTGQQSLVMSNTWGSSNAVTFTVGDATPVITGISPSVWSAGTTTNVAISGQGFGTNPQLSITCGGSSTCPAIDSYNVTGVPSDTQIMVSVTVDPSAPNEAVDLSVTSQGYGGSGFASTGSGQPSSSNAESATIAAEPSTSSFTVAYSSYIPVDHITGPGSCYYVVPTGSLLTYFIYKGDGGYGSYRTTESASFAPATLAVSNFFPMTGITRQYAFGSPANGSTLSYLDEDGVPNDCYLWNDTAQAPYSNFTYSSYNYQTNVGALTFSGNASNPLETTLAAIDWSMTTFIDLSNPSQPMASVTYNHTCYPAHQVKVGASNTVVYSYTPPSNTLPYITSCLTMGVNLLTEVSGTTPSVPVTAQ